VAPGERGSIALVAPLIVVAELERRFTRVGLEPGGGLVQLERAIGGDLVEEVPGDEQAGPVLCVGASADPVDVALEVAPVEARALALGDRAERRGSALDRLPRLAPG
jgi:hypothetical protein